MSYEEEQFLTTVAQHARLSWEAAERATEATLTTLAERLSAGEARDLAAKLPPEIARWLRAEDQAGGFGADEFMRRVAEREGTDPATAARHARAVFAALARAVGPREVADMTSELGKGYAPLLAGTDDAGEPEPALLAEEFVRRVADRAGIGEDGARRAVEAVLETLGERISGGEVEDLVACLPEEFHEPLRRGNELSNGAARRMSLDAFVRRIAEREGVTPDEAREQARAVFATLREAVPEHEFDDVVAQLPRDYAAVTARP
jgi:uncharacterized protein (DUF2267 family)